MLHRMIQKSPYMGKMFYLQNVLYMGIMNIRQGEWHLFALLSTRLQCKLLKRKIQLIPMYADFESPCVSHHYTVVCLTTGP